MKYFIQIDGEPAGPLTADQIRLRVSQRGLHGSDLIRREDEPPSQWHPLRSMEEFVDLSDALRPAGNPWAIISISLAVASVVLFVYYLSGSYREHFPWFWFVGLAAMIGARLARRRIRAIHDREVSGYVLSRVASWIAYVMVIGVAVLDALNPLGHPRISERGFQTKAISNCRQIIIALRLYSGDSSGSYPDLEGNYFSTSNEVFRECFKAGAIDNEMIFGCPMSPFQPDGNIGRKPDFAEAVKPGENHWAFTKGLADSSRGDIPFVYENVAETTWPPKWNAKLAGQAKPGRTWKNGKIIVGFNDSSVEVIQLDVSDPEHAVPRLRKDGKPVFPSLKEADHARSDRDQHPLNPER